MAVTTEEAGSMASGGAAALETRTFGDREMSEPAIVTIASGTAAVYSARSPAKETPNEDAAALVPINAETGILLVADGVGGLPSGDQASRLAIGAVRRAVEIAARDGTPLREAILDGIENANRMVLELGSGAATTLAVAKIAKGKVRPFHVGDSLVFVSGQRGRIKLQTISHSPVGYAVESGILDETEAVHHEERHFVSNIIGMSDMRMDVGPSMALAERDTLLLATDGLFDNFYPSEIVEKIRKGPLAEVARSLVEEGFERMQRKDPALPSKPDDFTFVVYRPESGRARRRR